MPRCEFHRSRRGRAAGQVKRQIRDTTARASWRPLQRAAAARFRSAGRLAPELLGELAEMNELLLEQRPQYRFLVAELVHQAALAQAALAGDGVQGQPPRPSRAMMVRAADKAALRDRSEGEGLSMIRLGEMARHSRPRT